jgi:uncharacterized membrane protein
VSSSDRRQRGFVLIAMCATLFLLMAMVGFAFDFGRIYIARNEAQVFTDAAAMSGAAKIDGTAAGLDKARGAVAALPNRWNFGASVFKAVVVEFSADQKQWSASPEKDNVSVEALQFVRVSAPANDVEITFLRMVGGPANLTVPARSVAAAKPVRLVE